MKNTMKIFILICLVAILCCGCGKKDKEVKIGTFYYEDCVDNYPDYLMDAPYISIEKDMAYFYDNPWWFLYNSFLAKGEKVDMIWDPLENDEVVYGYYSIDGDKLTLKTNKDQNITFTILDDETLEIDDDYLDYIKEGDIFKLSSAENRYLGNTVY